MKYQLKAIDDHAIGQTQFLIFTDVYVELAVIPWKKGELAKLNLHPDNMAAVPQPVDPSLALTPTASMPVFTPEELGIVLSTVISSTRKIQAENRQTMKYI
jgi:hypothetical protein